MNKIWSLIKETMAEWGEDHVSRLAAALAYYTVFALPPLLVIAIAVAGFAVGRGAAQEEIMAQVRNLIGEQGAAAVAAMIEGAQDTSTGIWATIISIVLLLFGASGVFIQLESALNTVWDVPPDKQSGFWETVRDRFEAVALVLGIGFLLLVSLVVSAGLSALGSFASDLLPAPGVVMQIANLLVSFAVITVLFALMFRYLPETEVEWGDVWLGAAITALLFMIGQVAIGLYLGRSAVASTYGAAGSLAVVLIWVYYTAQILLLGAEFTQVYAKQMGSRRGSQEEPQTVQTRPPLPEEASG